MKVVLLGTGSPLPDPQRAGPCTLVQAGAQNVMVDCGRGALMRLLAAGVLPGMIDHLFLTHLHSDHVTDVNDLVTTRWIMMPVHRPLHVWGPPGTRAMVDALLAMLGPDQSYRLAHHDDLRHQGPLQVEVTELSDGDHVDVDDLHVTAHRTDHRPVEPSIGFRMTHQGVVAAIAGDTVPCPGLDDLCRDADIYVQTVVRPDLVEGLAAIVPTGQRFLDILDYHSSVEQAGHTAARNGVKTLVLTHCVPAVQPGQEDEWRALAAPHFSGPVIVGPDLPAIEA
ncbi:MAG: MBL fold metallo-hydrolase [Actinomycetota bacterium]